MRAITQAIVDKKGKKIIAVDIHKVSSLTDFCIVAEGTVDRHVRAIAQAVIDTMQELGHAPIHVEGLQTGDWIVLDYMQIMVHIFTPKQREKYQLEQLLKEGELIDLALQEVL